MTKRHWHEMTLDEKIAKAKDDLENRTNRGPDGYQADKDLYWQLVAMKHKTTYAKINPMGFWHGVMSN